MTTITLDDRYGLKLIDQNGQRAVAILQPVPIRASRKHEVSGPLPYVGIQRASNVCATDELKVRSGNHFRYRPYVEDGRFHTATDVHCPG